jgi:hypothetical protein
MGVDRVGWIIPGSFPLRLSLMGKTLVRKKIWMRSCVYFPLRWESDLVWQHSAMEFWVFFSSMYVFIISLISSRLHVNTSHKVHRKDL